MAGSGDPCGTGTHEIVPRIIGRKKNNTNTAVLEVFFTAGNTNVSWHVSRKTSLRPGSVGLPSFGAQAGNIHWVLRCTTGGTQYCQRTKAAACCRKEYVKRTASCSPEIGSGKRVLEIHVISVGSIQQCSHIFREHQLFVRWYDKHPHRRIVG